MKKYLLPSVMGCIAVFTAVISLAWSKNVSTIHETSLFSDNPIVVSQEKPSPQAEKIIYTCPMHNAVLKDKPGKCPTCGMDLVKKDSEKVTFTCPMHSAVLKDKPGKCPSCGMDLVKKDAEKVTYTCPMHTAVLKDKPGKCPNCGMDLVGKVEDKDLEKK